MSHFCHLEQSLFRMKLIKINKLFMVKTLTSSFFVKLASVRAKKPLPYVFLSLLSLRNSCSGFIQISRMLKMYFQDLFSLPFQLQSSFPKKNYQRFPMIYLSWRDSYILAAGRQKDLEGVEDQY